MARRASKKQRKMERHITENELCESLKNKSASIDFVGGIKGFREIKPRTDEYGK